jgi:hypothetical protein
MNKRVLGFLMILGGAGLLVYGVVMKFFINAPLVRVAPSAEQLFFPKPPVARTGIPDYVPILAGAILLALGVLLRLGK